MKDDKLQRKSVAKDSRLLLLSLRIHAAGRVPLERYYVLSFLFIWKGKKISEIVSLFRTQTFNSVEYYIILRY